MLAVSVADGVEVDDGLAEPLGVRVGLGDPLDDPLQLGLADSDGDRLWLGVSASLGDAVALRVLVPVLVDEPLSVPLPLGVTERVRVCVAERLPVNERVPVPDGVAAWLDEPVGLRLCERVTELVSVDVGVSLCVPLGMADGVPV